MKKVLMSIPILTILANIVILLDIPILREIIVFLFLSFIPGFAVLGLFKLKEIGFLETVLFSVGLSIAFVMFIGLLVNELVLLLGFSQPLSTIPLIVAISAFTLVVFVVEYRRDLLETLRLKTSFEGKIKDVFPVSLLLIILPIISALGVLYLNVPVILLSYAIIAALCILSFVSRRLVPESLFPFLIFSISIALVFQVPLTSKYVVGYDANLEYYVFRLTQINGHWGFLNANTNPLIALTYNSMLSITLLPAIYSALMNAPSDLVFKILYPFIFSFTPIVLYRICEKQFGKSIGLLSALFFVFTYTAFYGAESLSLNRQIVGELFLVLSVFLLISKTIPVTKARLLLLFFGAALAISHYSLAYIYLAIVAVVFIISRVKPKFNGVLNVATVLLLFGLTFSWYIISSAPLVSLTSTLNRTFVDILTGVGSTSGTASMIFGLPHVFTVATWINLLITGIADLFLVVGVILIIFRPKITGISAQYSIMTIMAAIVLAITYAIPSISSILNFTRFYGITLLFLAPCFVLGGKGLLGAIGKVSRRLKLPLKRFAFGNKNMRVVFLLIAVILSAYFLSQTGFVNNVTNSAVHIYTIDFGRMKISNDPQVELNFYSVYIPRQDVFSAIWLLNHGRSSSTIYADYASSDHVLTSYGLIPGNSIKPIANSTIPAPDSFMYLSFLNVEDKIVSTYNGLFNSSEISANLEEGSLVYSNGAGEIWCTSTSG